MAQRGSGPQFQQDDGMDALDGSSQGDVGSDTPGSKGVAGDGRLRKKKKTRPYPGLSFSDGGPGADSGAKVEHAWLCIRVWVGRSTCEALVSVGCGGCQRCREGEAEANRCGFCCRIPRGVRRRCDTSRCVNGPLWDMSVGMGGKGDLVSGADTVDM